MSSSDIDSYLNGGMGSSDLNLNMDDWTEVSLPKGASPNYQGGTSRVQLGPGSHNSSQYQNFSGTQRGFFNHNINQNQLRHPNKSAIILDHIQAGAQKLIHPGESSLGPGVGPVNYRNYKRNLACHQMPDPALNFS